jgi:hypothetical protein
LREALDFGRDDGKTPARIASTGGLYGGVEREQVGLPRDAVDQIDDLSDLFGGLGQATYRFVRARCLFHGTARDGGRLRDLPAHLGDGGGKLLYFCYSEDFRTRPIRSYFQLLVKQYSPATSISFYPRLWSVCG